MAEGPLPVGGGPSAFRRSGLSLSAIAATANPLQKLFQFLDALLKFLDTLPEFLEFTVVVVMILVREHVRTTSPATPHHAPVPAKRLRTVHAAVLLLVQATGGTISTSIVVLFAMQPARITVSASVALAAIFTSVVVLFAMQSARVTPWTIVAITSHPGKDVPQVEVATCHHLADATAHLT